MKRSSPSSVLDYNRYVVKCDVPPAGVKRFVPPLYLRQPATGSLTQMQGWSESFRPCWWCVALHDVLSEKKGALLWGTPFRKDKVIYGDLSFGGQDGQP